MAIDSFEPVRTFKQPSYAAAARISFFTHAAKEILLIDFSDATNVALVRAVADECRRVITGRPAATVRTLVDVSGAWFDKETIQVASELASHNRPYVVRSAVIGVTGLRQVALNGIVALTRRNIRGFGSRAEALAWLVA